MRYSRFASGMAAAAALATVVALGACATTSTTPRATTPTTDVSAPAGPTMNTGAAVPTTTDTNPAPPSGAGSSVATVGRGNANLGTGVTPGSVGGSAAVSADGTMLSNLGGDAHIVSTVDVISTGEIAAGMLARERATLPQIRAFANQMVQEHTQLQTRDRALAKDPIFIAGDSAQIAREMVQHNRDELAKLQQAPAGAAFDAMYMADQVSDHEQALTVLDAAKTQARDGKVADLVKAAIDKVQQHLNEAKAITATMTR